MSSDSSNAEENTKVYKIRSKKGFPIWKQKIMSVASSKGFEQYLTKDIAIKTQDELDNLETAFINKNDDAKRRVMKGELAKYKRERKRSLAAAELITINVRNKDLKKMTKCKHDPKQMFKVLPKKDANKEDEDLDDLLDNFKICKLRSRKVDPEEDWFAELDEVNEQLEEIDPDFKKSEKEIAVHILSNLLRGYKTCKDFIKLGDDYLDDIKKINKQVTKHWKAKHRKRNKKYESNSSDESSSSSDSSDDERAMKKKKRKDLYALNIEEDNKDTYDKRRVII